MAEENIPQQLSVPVIEEELVTGTRAVKTGSVRVNKKVEHIRKTVDIPLLKDVVNVTRVPVNQPVSSIPETREEGDTLIIPVLEEEIVINKRIILKEEIHIVRRRLQEHAATEVILGREHATIERLDAEGQAVRPEPDR